MKTDQLERVFAFDLGDDETILSRGFSGCISHWTQMVSSPSIPCPRSWTRTGAGHVPSTLPCHATRL